MIFSALVPPGNIDKELELYKRGLFSRFGTVSSLVLPTLIPRTGAAPPSRGTAPGQHYRTGSILVREEGLFLEILRPGETPPRASSPLLSSKEPLPRPLSVPHLFLMDWKGEGFDIPPDLPEPPVLSWQKGSLVTFDIILAPRGFWWEQVFLKEIL